MKIWHLGALAILGLLLTACSGAAPPDTFSTPQSQDHITGNSTSSPADMALTPTLPPVDTALWIAPEVPAPLRSAAETLALREDIRLVGEPDAADVRLEAGGEHPVSVWIYAAVVPFPRTRDEMGLEDLVAVWRGATSYGRLYVSDATYAAMESLWGPAPAGQAEVMPETVAPDVVWQSLPAMAILPFEELEPAWKVLQIEGISPLQHDFNPARYPLVVVFGLSGDSASVNHLQALGEWPAVNREPQKLTVLAMTGTTALARTTAARMYQYGPEYPARDILPWLQGADLLHISHEVSFAGDCPTPDPFQVDLRFCSDPDNLALFEYIGVDVVELTGNHNLDWGIAAYIDTLEAYHALGYVTYGGGEDLFDAQQGVVVEHHGNEFFFIGCNLPGPVGAWAGETTPGAARCDDAVLLPQVTAAREAGYIPIVTYQWNENATVSYTFEEAAHRAVEAGALIVSGSQAHQALGFEFYEDGFIHYGLGNLFFDQMQSQELRREFIDRYIIYDGRIIGVELLTAMLEDYARPRPMTAWEREVFLQEIFRMSGW